MASDIELERAQKKVAASQNVLKDNIKYTRRQAEIIVGMIQNLLPPSATDCLMQNITALVDNKSGACAWAIHTIMTKGE